MGVHFEYCSILWNMLIKRWKRWLRLKITGEKLHQQRDIHNGKSVTKTGTHNMEIDFYCHFYCLY